MIVMAYIDIEILVNFHSLTKEEDVLHKRRKLPAVANLMARRYIYRRWDYHAAVDLVNASLAGRHLFAAGVGVSWVN